MPGKSKTQIVQKFNEAMLLFIFRNQPEGLNLAYLNLLLSSGRMEEATEYLNNFTVASAEICDNCGHSKEDHLNGNGACLKGSGHGNTCPCLEYEAKIPNPEDEGQGERGD